MADFEFTPKKVFISYSHDTRKHTNRVLALSNRLRDEGVDCQVDQYEESPPQGWARWMEDQIEWADFVLVICTETYLRRFRGKEGQGKGKGATWEGAIISQEIYDAHTQNTRFIPIVFALEEAEHIPTILRGGKHYDISTEEGYEELYRRLTGQPLVEKPPLGPRRARERKTDFFEDATKWALLVGINEYERADVTPLSFAVNDVRAFAETLTTICGFPEDHVFALTSDNPDEKPTRGNIAHRFHYLAQQVKPNDTFLFFFAGHGVFSHQEDASYLLTYEADTRSHLTLRETCLPAKRVQEWLNAISAHTVLAIYDACRNEPVRARGESDNLLTDSLARDLGVTVEPALTSPVEVSATFYSCKVGQRSYEWEARQHGFFTYFLVEGLNGKAADADGKMTLKSLESYLAQEVPQATLQEKNVRQDPWVVWKKTDMGNVILTPLQTTAVQTGQRHRSMQRRRLPQVKSSLWIWSVSVLVIIAIVWGAVKLIQPLSVQVCISSGDLATDYCKQAEIQQKVRLIETRKFIKGSEPTDKCLHQPCPNPKCPGKNKLEPPRPFIVDKNWQFCGGCAIQLLPCQNIRCSAIVCKELKKCKQCGTELNW